MKRLSSSGPASIPDSATRRFIFRVIATANTDAKTIA